MEALAEQIVTTYLTRGGKVFIVPQYPVPSDDPGTDWSCPDFVALDFEHREVVVVEVASGSNIASLLKKARNREHQWFGRLWAKLLEDHVITDAWHRPRLLAFIRRKNVEKARRALNGEQGVAFFAIEDATFAWDYWEDRTGGLPR